MISLPSFMPSPIPYPLSVWMRRNKWNMGELIERKGEGEKREKRKFPAASHP
jgi:hypothetical protein